MRIKRSLLASLGTFTLLSCADSTVTGPAVVSPHSPLRTVVANGATSTGIPFAALVPFAEVYGLNSSAEIVGGMFFNGEHHGFVYHDGIATDLGTLGGNDSQALGVNDSRQVVGRSLTADGNPHAFLWQSGTMIDLGVVVGNSAEARAINNNGVIVGINGRYPFVWRSGTMSHLPTMGGSGGSANAINDLGVIAGYSWTADFSARHAVTWTNGVLLDLGLVNGASNAEATGINSAGQVVGRLEFPDGHTSAFLWQAGVMTDIGGLGGSQSSATAINATGQIAGNGPSAGSNLAHGWSWNAGSFLDLGVETGASSGNAYAINANGQIAGNGGRTGGIYFAAPSVVDTQAPTITSLSFSTTSVNTTSADAQITVTAQLKDNLSGVKDTPTLARFTSPSGAQFQLAFLTRIAGTPLDGTYQGTLTLPRFSEPGTWRIEFINLADRDENLRTVTTSDLIAAGFTTTIANTSVADTKPPILAAFSFDPAQTNTSTSDAVVVVSARIIDDLSGVQTAPLVFRVSSKSGLQFQVGFLTRTAGTALDGTYTANLTIPRFSEAGEWRLEVLNLGDAAKNQISLSTADVRALGSNPTFENVSVQDTKSPTLLAFSIAPATVNTSAADAPIHVTARIVDDISGVQATPIVFRLSSPTNAQFQVGFLTLSSGTPLDGTYSAVVTIPRFSEPGPWKFEVINIADKASNSHVYGVPELSALGFPTTVTNINTPPDNTPPEVSPHVTGTLGTNNWYTSNVSVTFTVMDPESTPTSSGCESRDVSTNTSGVTFTCTATSAGGTSTRSVTVKRDDSPPTLTGTPSGALGSNGWFVGDVTVSWSATDDISGVPPNPCAGSLINTDGQNVTTACTAQNGAGLSTTRSVSVKRDVTKPVVSYAGNLGTYSVDQSVAITCSASDATSGVASTTCSNLAGPAYAYAVGMNEYSATATDSAGNVGTATARFMVSVSALSVCNVISRFVSDQGVANSLCTKVEHGSVGAIENELNAISGKKIAATDAAVVLRLARALWPK